MLKNNVDVQNIQNAKRPQTNYRKQSAEGILTRFLFECSVKLALKPVPTSTTAILFHRFCQEAGNSADYDYFLIISACIYLSGKIEDEPVKIRDIINVTHNTLHREAAPLELGDEYWSIRDAIVQAELLLIRMLQFNLNVDHPHKYIGYYLKTLKDWMGSEIWSKVPIARTAVSFLQDFHHSPDILKYESGDIALSCISLALQTYGIQVPLTDEGDESQIWFQIFNKNLTKDKIWQITESIIEVYNKDAELN